MFAWKKAGVPGCLRDRLTFGAGAHDDKSRKIIGNVAKSVSNPGTHAGTPRDGGSRVHEGMRRVVIDLISLLGANNANVVGDFLNIGKQV